MTKKKTAAAAANGSTEAVVVGIRVEKELQERGRRLAKTMADASATSVAFGKPSISGVFRLALLRGLEQLEREHTARPRK